MTNPVPDPMLFAAGLGTRMRPLTDRTPKPLLAVGGRPLFEHALAAAMAEGHRRFVVNLHHRAGQMAAHLAALRARFPEIAIAESDERDQLRNTGGGLRKALPLLATDPVATLNTDSFWLPGSDTPLGRMRALFAEGKAEMVLLCVTPDRATGFGGDPDFRLANDGRLTQTEGEPVIYAGAALLSRSLAATGHDEPFSLYRHMRGAGARGALFGVPLEARWFHAGDPAALAACDAAYSEMAP